jgi:hypothetical protein
MRFIFGIILVLVTACNPVPTHAQSGAINLFDEASTYGNDFLNQPATQAGVVVKNGCSAGKLTGRRSYIIKSYVIYWGLSEECVRVVVNHRATDPSPTPASTYLGVQVIGFYDVPQSTSIILRRKGTFVRDGKVLPPYDDKALSSDELDHDTWDTLNSSGTLQAVDEKVGTWHGTPQGGTHNSWDDRRWFRTGRTYDAQLQVKSKALDNRLIRFTPYPMTESPQDGPLGFNVNRRGARAVVVRVFSPSNADYDRSFALIYESDPAKVSQLVNRQIVQAGFGFWRLFR